MNYFSLWLKIFFKYLDIFSNWQPILAITNGALGVSPFYSFLFDDHLRWAAWFCLSLTPNQHDILTVLQAQNVWVRSSWTKTSKTMKRRIKLKNQNKQKSNNNNLHLFLSYLSLGFVITLKDNKHRNESYHYKKFHLKVWQLEIIYLKYLTHTIFPQMLWNIPL